MTYSPETWVKGSTAATAARLQNIEDGIEAIDQCSGASITDVTSSRVLATHYANTSGKTMLVMVSVQVAAYDGNATWNVTVKLASGTTRGVSQHGHFKLDYITTMQTMVAVPPGAEYRISEYPTGKCTIDCVAECVIQ